MIEKIAHALSAIAFFNFCHNFPIALFRIINLLKTVAYDLPKEQILQAFEKGIKGAF